VAEEGVPDPLEEFQEHLSWFKGQHSLKFGFNMLWAEWDDFGASDSLFGKVGFTSRFTAYLCRKSLGIP